MINKELKQQINQTAKAAKELFKYCMPKGEKIVVINTGLPYIAINLGNGTEYFFQGEEASFMLDEVTQAAEKFSTSIENTLLWLAQGWG
jgi:hypothetical protein